MSAVLLVFLIVGVLLLGCGLYGGAVQGQELTGDRKSVV